MYFLVQSNIYSNADYKRVIEELKAQNIEFETIHLDASISKIEIKPNRKDVFVYGSVKLARLAKANKDWYPGSFYGGNHLYEIYAPYYKDNLLNYNVQVCSLTDDMLWQLGEEKFIKPYRDAKIFTGKVFTELKWKDFIKNTLAHPQTPLLNKDALVQCSPSLNMIKEARCWIVGDKIVDAVYYKIHEDIPFEKYVEPKGIAFAKEMINIYSVAPAFVMDICLTTQGWKIVEINCINSAGLYPNSNVANLIKALNGYFS